MWAHVLGDARSEGERAAAGRDAVHASAFHFKWGGWQWVYADRARPTCQLCWLQSIQQGSGSNPWHGCGSGGGGGHGAVCGCHCTHILGQVNIDSVL